jgi:hypothetical protein
MTRRIDQASARQTQPWREHGMSRATWFRQRARAGEAGKTAEPGETGKPSEDETGMLRQRETDVGLEVIRWRPGETCAHCGRQDTLVYLVQSPFKEVPNEVLHLHHAAAWFVAAARQVTRHCVQEEGSP